MKTIRLFLFFRRCGYCRRAAIRAALRSRGLV